MPAAPPPPLTTLDAAALAQAMRLPSAAAAEEATRQWAARFPLQAAGWAALAQVLQRQGRHAEALKALQRAAARAGPDPAPHHNLGNGLRKLGRLDEAADAYRHALGLQPARASSHFGLGNVWRDQGRLDEALAAYRRALDLQPGHAEAALALGNALQEAGDMSAAERAYVQAAGARPDWPAPHFNRHALRLAAGDLAGAIDALQQVLARDPDGSRGHFFLGLLLDEAGEATRAQAHLARAAQAAPPAPAWVDALQWVRGQTARGPGGRGGRGPQLCGHAPQVFALALAAARADGLVLEFGVRWGRSIRQIAALVDGPVHGFDSFQGLPEDWHDEPAGSYSTQGALPAVPPQVQLHAGWFEHTLPAFLQAQPGPVRLVNIDCDLYRSTLTVLDGLAPRLLPGSVLVFDEFIGNAHWREDEFKAFHEAAARHGWRHELLAFSFATKQVALRLLARA
jgi:tetratricopeptide (TPR) repeat protein